MAVVEWHAAWAFFLEFSPCSGCGGMRSPGAAPMAFDGDLSGPLGSPRENLLKGLIRDLLVFVVIISTMLEILMGSLAAGTRKQGRMPSFQVILGPSAASLGPVRADSAASGGMSAGGVEKFVCVGGAAKAAEPSSATQRALWCGRTAPSYADPSQAGSVAPYGFGSSCTACTCMGDVKVRLCDLKI